MGTHRPSLFVDVRPSGLLALLLLFMISEADAPPSLALPHWPILLRQHSR